MRRPIERRLQHPGATRAEHGDAAGLDCLHREPGDAVPQRGNQRLGTGVGEDRVPPRRADGDPGQPRQAFGGSDGGDGSVRRAAVAAEQRPRQDGGDP